MPETFSGNKIITITMIISGFAIFLSLLGLYYSYRSNQLSNKSNQISEKANRIAQEAVNQIYQTVRPQLSISAVKEKSLNKYIKIIDDGKSLSISYFFNVKNRGNATARDIFFPVSLKQEFHQQRFAISQEPILPKILGIGEQGIIDFGFTINNITQDDKEKEIEKITNEFTTLSIILHYSHEQDEEIKYKSEYKCKVKMDEAVEIMSDIKKL